MSHYWWIRCKKCGDDSPVGPRLWQDSEATDFICKNPSILKALDELQYFPSKFPISIEIKIGCFITVEAPAIPYSECGHEWEPVSEYGEHRIGDLEPYVGPGLTIEIKIDGNE